MTSHAAVVARGWGKCCVSGASTLNIDYKSRTISRRQDRPEGRRLDQRERVHGHGVRRPDPDPGQPVVLGVVQADKEAGSTRSTRCTSRFSDWSDEFRKMKVRTNADLPKDAQVAQRVRRGRHRLCRTEHMFFEGERIWAVREFILADDKPSAGEGAGEAPAGPAGRL